MTKYYFISYMYKSEKGLQLSHGLFKAINNSLNQICEETAEFNNVSPKLVVITCLKDLTEKEYKMLNGMK